MISDILSQAIADIERWQKRYDYSGGVYDAPEIKAEINRVKEDMRQLIGKLRPPPQEYDSRGEFLNISESESYRHMAGDDLAIMAAWLAEGPTAAQRAEILKSQELLRPIVQKGALTYEDCRMIDSVVDALDAVGLSLHTDPRDSVNAEDLWEVIAATERAALEQDPRAQTAPEDTRALLEYVFNLADEQGCLILADYRRFRAWGWQDADRSLTIILSTMEEILARSMTPTVRRFLRHFCHFAWYLREPEREDGRDHWWDIGPEGFISAVVSGRTSRSCDQRFQ
jgi:hypothetical protein